MNDEPGVFDEFLHSPVRLRICGLLANADSIEFHVVRETLGLTDAHLSKSVKALADAGYISVHKRASEDRNDSRRLTWIALTPVGYRSFAQHFRALRAIAAGEPEPHSP